MMIIFHISHIKVVHGQGNPICYLCGSAEIALINPDTSVDASFLNIAGIATATCGELYNAGIDALFSPEQCTLIQANTEVVATCCSASSGLAPAITPVPGSSVPGEVITSVPGISPPPMTMMTSQPQVIIQTTQPSIIVSDGNTATDGNATTDENTVADIINTEPDLTVLATAVNIADLFNALEQNTTNITIFAPIDQAGGLFDPDLAKLATSVTATFSFVVATKNFPELERGLSEGLAQYQVVVPRVPVPEQ